MSGYEPGAESLGDVPANVQARYGLIDPVNPKESHMKYKPAQVRKAAVAAVTFAANLVAAGVIDGKAALIVMAGISALGVFGVFAVKNADA